MAHASLSLALAFFTVAAADCCLAADVAQKPGVTVAIATDSASAPVMQGKPSGQILAAGSNRVLILNPDGKVVWEHGTKQAKTGDVQDAWMLPNGNVLFADGLSVTEVTREHKIVFQYIPKEQKGGGAFSCQRLDNGNTVIGENATGKILEVDPSGKVVFELQTNPSKVGNHLNMRMVRKLDSGNYLVCMIGASQVHEYSPDGKKVMEIKAPSKTFSAIRTPQGTTLVSAFSGVFEYDKTGKEIWKFVQKDLPELALANFTGMSLFPNGDIAVGVLNAYNKDGKGTGMFAITRDRKLVWRYANPKGDKKMLAVQLLDNAGNTLPGKCLR